MRRASQAASGRSTHPLLAARWFALCLALNGTLPACTPAGSTVAQHAHASDPAEATVAAAGMVPDDGDRERQGGWRLATEHSPYLRQHADNPVNWFPWGDEAFALAARLDRPIFLSIGYSSCHWCHVMEHESFEDQATADLLNQHFVCIKVDREQRPDVDDRYMTAVQAMTGSGGWPLSVWLTPAGDPFYGGTYFPPVTRGGLPAFRSVLGEIQTAWADDRQPILDAVAHNGPLFLRDAMPGPQLYDAAEQLAAAVRALEQALDPVLGGMAGSRPQRFPPSQVLSFLMRRARRGVEVDLDRVRTTLDAMAEGGLFDHVGGGFHRYSTDPRWEIPHFEKMLYDNALLAATYAEAFALTGEPRHARVARATLGWLTADMRSPEGLYYSARDADSLPFDSEGRALPDGHAEEGDVYTWTPAELVAVLGEDDGPHLAARYGVTPDGNFERGRSQLRLQGRDESDRAWREQALARLLVARSRRPQAFRDEKCLTAWNGLTLTAFATAGSLLDDPDLLAQCRDLGRALVRESLWRDESGALQVHHQLFEGHASGEGDLADHAYLARGLLDAYGATGEPAFLAAAWELATAVVARFADPEKGGFFLTRGSDPRLPHRGRELEDGAVPSSQSVTVQLLVRLGPLDDASRFSPSVATTLDALAPLVGRNAPAFPSLAIALDAAAGPLAEVVLAGDPDSPAYRELYAAVRRTWLPAELLLPQAATAAEALAGVGVSKTPGLLEERRADPRRPTAWICKAGTCLLPVHEPDALDSQWSFVLEP